MVNSSACQVSRYNQALNPALTSSNPQPFPSERAKGQEGKSIQSNPIANYQSRPDFMAFVEGSDQIYTLGVNSMHGWENFSKLPSDVTLLVAPLSSGRQNIDSKACIYKND